MSDDIDPSLWDKFDLQQQHHSKCSFCGSHNGLYGRPLEQHTTRCRYKGNANTFEVSVPNYYVLIAQDDQTFLPMMHALRALPKLQQKLAELEERLSKKEIPA
jgi:hypothetical protein